jgi:V/A-type H+-transporting ATPase subunit I
MQKVAILGHAQVLDETFAYLQKNGTVEITRVPFQTEEKEIAKESLELELAELESAIRFIGSVAGKKKSFIETFAPPKEILSEEQLNQFAREFDWRSLVSKIEDHETQLANLKNLEHTLLQELAVIWPWRSLDLKLNQLICGKKVCISAGSCKSRELEALQSKLEKLSPTQQVEIINSTRDKVFLLVFYLASEARPFQDLLSKLNFEKTILPVPERTPAQEIEHLEQLRQEAAKDRELLIGEIRSQLKNLPRLTYIYDHLFQKELERVAREKLAHTKRTFVLTGWTPQGNFEKLKAGLKKVTPLADVLAVKPEEKEIPPTLIHNPKALYPFEIITRIFGLPAQGEIDPTGALSFFYILFFAMCLSDVGYGTILSLLSYYYLRTLTLTEGGKKLLLLLFWGGIATVFAGVLTGSYFGIDTSQLPPILRQLQIIDPIKSPLNVLILSLFLGVFQNLTGVAIAMYWKMRNREYLNALLDDGLWIYFLSCLVLLVAASGMGSPLSGLFGKLSIVGAVLLALTQGRNEPTILKKAIFGILALYRTTSYLGDTLSYSRLLALMMTTSIIGMVINIIAGMTRGVPVVGYLLMIVILVFGHTFNLIVSTLGAFIHSTRLQLVEFFGKFYSGGGREFKPFRRETKYVIIE